MCLPPVVTSAPNPWTLALPGPFNGLQIMIYLLLYLIIILLEKPLVLSAMAMTRQRFRSKSLDYSVPEIYVNLEPFTCLRSGLKKVNKRMFLCQMQFGFQAGGNLFAPEKTNWQISGNSRCFPLKKAIDQEAITLCSRF